MFGYEVKDKNFCEDKRLQSIRIFIRINVKYKYLTAFNFILLLEALYVYCIFRGIKIAYEINKQLQIQTMSTNSRASAKCCFARTGAIKSVGTAVTIKRP